MFDICTVGHITKDHVITKSDERFMPGGTAYYFTKALEKFDISSALITAVGQQEMETVEGLWEAGFTVFSLASAASVYFENIYADDGDGREQNVLAIADPFTIEAIPQVNANIYHLGPLLAQDISSDLLMDFASKGTVSLDAQGYLRRVEKRKVIYEDWKDKKKALPFVSILKANEQEMEILTGCTNPHEGAEYLANLGVKEVIITLGSKGSLILCNNEFSEIPAYKPKQIADATGCGDTYMAGYLYMKVKGATIVEAANFAAAMATLKLEQSGPFNGNPQSVRNVLASNQIISD